MSNDLTPHPEDGETKSWHRDVALNKAEREMFEAAEMALDHHGSRFFDEKMELFQQARNAYLKLKQETDHAQ